MGNRPAETEHVYVGLMSGTSADGVDAALVGIAGCGEQAQIDLRGFEFLAYPDDLRAEVLAAGEGDGFSTARLCRLNAVLGAWFARAAAQVCQACGVATERVRAIGSHGQTVHHLPEPVEAFGVVTRSTLQLADPSVIAERTGVTTVADFRSRDVAAGGQGAPLVPMADYILFRSETTGRVMLNIGGIANLTVLPAGCGLDEVFAFDTGPGNMLIDGLVAQLTEGAQKFDEGGAIAAAGRPDAGLLSRLMQHPYLLKPPPKSTGREVFGNTILDDLLSARNRLSHNDLVRTVSAFTAQSIADAIEQHVRPRCVVDEVIVSGGGSENPVLLELLDNALGGTPLLRVDSLGVASEAKEAVAFAVLANETLNGSPGNVPAVTGAAGARVLGLVAPGRNTRIWVD